MSSPAKHSLDLAGNDPASTAMDGSDKIIDAGRLEEHYYDDTLQWWRACVRRVLVKQVERETKLIAYMQERVRTPWFDAYFKYTSSLGTHTFFLTVLPIFFFFGFFAFGRGLVLTLGLGVYLTSVIKDLVCSPRPFVPQVTRLTISSHHLEYGFPSTHSAHSVSIALFFFYKINPLYASGAISSPTFAIAIAALFIYVFSIVYGRIYTGMHSFTDCTVGVLLGVITWALQYFLMDAIDTWIATGGWIVPFTIIAVCMLMVNQHPQPVDDCPCFEDAIAFVSVIMGGLVGRWFTLRNGFDSDFYGPQLGSSYDSWTNISLWWIVALAKVVIGVSLIFAWRLIAKYLLRSSLPPIFRFLASIFTLPNRRFYTPATDYTTVPSETGLSAIPSVIDLPSQLELEIDEVTASTGRFGKKNVGVLLGRADMKNRKLARGNGLVSPVNATYNSKFGGLANQDVRFDNEDSLFDEEPVKHYDADVLTKVFVYAGIGLLAIELLAIMFQMMGLGVKVV